MITGIKMNTDEFNSFTHKYEFEKYYEEVISKFADV